jgi:hypothetical protein
LFVRGSSEMQRRKAQVIGGARALPPHEVPPLKRAQQSIGARLGVARAPSKLGHPQTRRRGDKKQKPDGFIDGSNGVIHEGILSCVERCGEPTRCHPRGLPIRQADKTDARRSCACMTPKPRLQTSDSYSGNDKPCWHRARRALVGLHQHNLASQRADLDAVVAALTLESVVIVVHDLSGHVGIRPAFFLSTGVLWDEINQRVKNLPRAAHFKKPVHIIFGVDDPVLNAGVAREFKRMFSNASLDLIDDANHYVQLDQADQVSRIMLEKLR